MCRVGSIAHGRALHKAPQSGRNCGFDLSLRKFSIKISVANGMSLLPNTGLKGPRYHLFYLTNISYKAMYFIQFYFQEESLNLGPLHTREWEPVSITLQALSLADKVEVVQVRFTLRLRDQWSMWMQDGCKVYMDSYMASNGSCFMVVWIVFINHFLEVGLTQNRKTTTLQMLATIDLPYFYHVRRPTWIK